MKKVCVLGWYGKHNCGDESYKLAFPTIFPGYDFSFVDTLTPAVKESSDAFILGGGDILSPGMIGQFDGITKPRHIISATASNQAIDAEKLRQFTNIIVRDYHSVEMLQEKGLKPAWMPDVAMVLRGNKVRGAKKIKDLFAADDGDCYSKIVSVVVNSYLLQEDHPLFYWSKTVEFLQFANQLAGIADNTSASFIFLPFGGRMPFDDRVASSWIASRCKFWKKNVVFYDDPADVQTILDIVAASDAVISTRLHSSIFAVGNGVPVIDVTHNHKNQWFLETVGLGDYSTSYHNFNPVWCKDLLYRLLLDPQPVKDYLQKVANKQSNIINSTTKIGLV